MKNEMSLDWLSSVISYDASTGDFWWLKKKRGRPMTRPAGTVRHDGYRMINIDGSVIYQHRLAWLFANGVWPEFEIDHIDGNPSNNRLQNLRLAVRHQNAKNAGRHSNNTSGYKGVDFRKSDGKWRARIRVKGKRINLGLFDDPLKAFKAYKKAADDLHGRFANHG